MSHRVLKTSVPGLVLSLAVLLQPVLQAQTPALDSEQWAMLTLMNNLRAKYGVAPLQVSVTLQNASQWMATDMATNNYFSSRDSLRRFSDARFRAFGYSYSAEEGIAEGMANAQDLFNQWMTTCFPNSIGGCSYLYQSFMREPGYTVVGIGRGYNANTSTKWSWTIDMGTFKDQTISPTSAPPPVISNFTSVPSTINDGSSTTLAWNLSNATTVTLDNGLGDVSNQSFKAVTPPKTTTYTLTATNSGGSTTAKATVTVNSFDTQPPTPPVLMTAIPKSPTQVDLSWGASIDNVGVAAYQVIRNGFVQGNVSGTTLSYSDTSVIASTTYTYLIKADDAAGNYSASSNSLSATTPAPAPVSTSACPAALNNTFAGCYFGNTTLSGNPTKTTSDPQIMFDWSNAYVGRPAPQTNFSVRWQGNFTFSTGTYNFTTVTSDGIRVFIDGGKVLDKWFDQSPSLYTASTTLTAGSHLVVVEFYNKTGWPISYLWWSKQ